MSLDSHSLLVSYLMARSKLAVSEIDKGRKEEEGEEEEEEEEEEAESSGETIGREVIKKQSRQPCVTFHLIRNYTRNWALNPCVGLRLIPCWKPNTGNLKKAPLWLDRTFDASRALKGTGERSCNFNLHSDLTALVSSPLSSLENMFLLAENIIFMPSRIIIITTFTV
ncbi:hypothetical protein V1477_010123 [Vespula maculifrons]|uniref:Uncharacterized protein n=1 Tax=Vespula maculifrons TaxID=7453 RepID=A0ABD2CBQ2_VESMC